MSKLLLDCHLDEIAKILKIKSEGNCGFLPELERIAWHAYLSTDVMDHVEYDQIRHHFLSFEEDPDTNDPVLSIAIGKHYFEHDPDIPEGDCLYETEVEGLSRKIEQDKKHFGGELTPGFAVAWSGKLLGLHDCQEITDQEYEQLKAMLPEMECNPVEELKVLTRKYMRR